MQRRKVMRAVGFALGVGLSLGVVLAGTAAQAQTPCDGVDTALTDVRRHGYAGLIAQEIGQGLQPAEVSLYWFAGSGGWSVVNGDIPTADSAYFFFETIDGRSLFRDVWAGMAEPSEQPDISDWATQLGAPADLADCFAARATGADSPGTAFGFTVTLSFSERALETLTRRGEAVIVSAAYRGDPTPEGAGQADEVGQINLGREEVQVAAAEGPVAITGSGVLPDMLQWSAEGSMGVNVNVFSARLSSEDNLLSCDFIDGPLADVRAAAMPVPLHCGLIEEDPDTFVRP